MSGCGSATRAPTRTPCVLPAATPWISPGGLVRGAPAAVAARTTGPATARRRHVPPPSLVTTSSSFEESSTMPDPKPDEQTNALLPQTLDDLRGKTPDELRQMFDVVDAHAKSLHMTDTGELRDLDENEARAMA